VRDYDLRDGVFTSVPIGRGMLDFPPILDELVRVGETRDRFVLAMEMDLDSGGPDEEDEAVRECARYMADWYSRTLEAPVA
jgi:sugar phosphate isomerase/epimerase